MPEFNPPPKALSSLQRYKSRFNLQASPTFPIAHDVTRATRTIFRNRTKASHLCMKCAVRAYACSYCCNIEIHMTPEIALFACTCADACKATTYFPLNNELVKSTRASLEKGQFQFQATGLDFIKLFSRKHRSANLCTKQSEAGGQSRATSITLHLGR